MRDIMQMLGNSSKILLIHDSDRDFALAMRSQARGDGVHLDQVGTLEDMSVQQLENYSAVIVRTELRRPGDIFHVNRIKQHCGKIPLVVAGNFLNQQIPRRLTRSLKVVNLAKGCAQILQAAVEKSQQYRATLAVQYLI